MASGVFLVIVSGIILLLTVIVRNYLAWRSIKIEVSRKFPEAKKEDLYYLKECWNFNKRKEGWSGIKLGQILRVARGEEHGRDVIKFFFATLKESSELTIADRIKGKKYELVDTKWYETRFVEIVPVQNPISGKPQDRERVIVWCDNPKDQGDCSFTTSCEKVVRYVGEKRRLIQVIYYIQK